MEIQYGLFALIWLALIAAYVTFVVRLVRDIHTTAWLRDAEAARAIWTLAVIAWVLLGPLVWLVYRNWRERSTFDRPPADSRN